MQIRDEAADIRVFMDFKLLKRVLEKYAAENLEMCQMIKDLK